MDAIVEKLFCDYGALKPKLRLSKFSNNWKEVKLKDICDRIKSKNDNQNNTNVLTISALYGIVSQESYFNKSVASLNLSNYYLLQNGDFAYNKSYSKDYAWGAIKRLIKYKEGVLSPLYICFRPNKSIDSDFLSHYFESAKWHKVISDIAGEGARNHGLLNISIIDFFNTKHKIPSKEEQIYIAKFLNLLDIKIENECKLYESLRVQKKHILKSMFI